ncbi:MAG TPA: RluA family pseudouridine synthase [Bacteroidales bacterium]|jgi:23S rRNA pseudouridine1911/1915/1917 synthase|nr:RluA family pseudouridine synthase [Bacteroidales bacterium]HRR04286.1 RluA family pseudouridine synthase [Bacteroidales bacterium]HRT13245.1 RluA family pseudouridine synthase [Bacteroidales bacterium]
MEENSLFEEKEDLYEHFNFKVDKGTDLVRIDKYLLNLIPNTSRNKIQQAAKAECVIVNGKPVKQNYRVKPFDVISILMPYPPREIEIIPENIPLDIVYEDDDIIIINKNAGLVVHPGYGNYTGTLVNALTYYFLNKIDNQGNPINPLLVHRIDKDTSGLLLVAKSEYAQIKLANDFYHHTIHRKYYALVWGDFKEDEGTVTAHIGRNPKDRLVMTVFPDGESGKHAVTHYKVVERFGYVTLIECQLETGRTHQIRVHLKSIRHPLFNDATYGGDRILKGTTFTKYRQFIQNCFKLLPRQALHAKSLGFTHPITGKQLFFDSPLPEDMQAVIDKWRNYSQHKKYEEEDVIDVDLK